MGGGLKSEGIKRTEWRPAEPMRRIDAPRWTVPWRAALGWGIFFLFLAWMLVGCTHGIPLRHPDGRLATCGGSTMIGLAAQLRAADRDRDCVADFQRQGFQRMP